MYKYITIIFFIILNISCKTVEKDSNHITFSNWLLPGTRISGITAVEDGLKVLYITDIRFFSNWGNGWTEGYFQASGKYYIREENNKIKLMEIDRFELWDILSGEIRHHSKYYRKDDGLQKVRNRIDRLVEFTKEIRERSGIEVIDDKNMKNLNIYLFPEANNLKKLERKGHLPEYFKLADVKKEVVTNSGINWRTDYTKSLFPKELWDLRNSGTLYRDFQEAPNIFKSIYNLEACFSQKEIICRY